MLMRRMLMLLINGVHHVDVHVDDDVVRDVVRMTFMMLVLTVLMMFMMMRWTSVMMVMPWMPLRQHFARKPQTHRNTPKNS